MDDRWFRRPLPRPDAETRLICLPHAGGSAGFYRWLADLGPHVEVLIARYPGRESRFAEPVPESLRDLVDALLPALPDGPLAFFGHSMGASIAYELALRTEPTALIVSGRVAPRWQRQGARHLGSDANILARIESLGGTGAEVLADPDLRELIVEVMRADLRMLDTYEPTLPGRLAAPITALTGRDDAGVPARLVQAWADVTKGGFDLQILPGGHFFLVGQADAVRTALGQALSSRK